MATMAESDTVVLQGVKLVNCRCMVHRWFTGQSIKLLRNTASQEKTILLLLATIPLGLQLALVATYSVNFPNADDFDVYLYFLNRFVTANSWSDKLALLFEPHGQHLQVMDRTVALAIYQVTGAVNFRVLVITGSLSLGVLLYLLYQATRRAAPVSLLEFLPVVFLLCQPQYAEATQWATTSWQFLWSAVFALWAFTAAFDESRERTAIAIIATVFAMLTQGNGILVAPIIGAVFVLRRQISFAAFWLGVGMVTCAGLNLSSLHSMLPRGVSQSSLVDLADYATSMVGSALGFSRHCWALGVGGAIVACFAFVTAKQTYARSPALYSFVLFGIASAAANAVARLPHGIALSYTTGRYTFVSILTVISVYLLLRLRWPRGKTRTVFCLLCGSAASVFWGLSYWANSSEYLVRYQLLNDANLRWHLSASGLPYSPRSRGQSIFANSLAGGVFELPAIAYERFISRPCHREVSGKQRRFLGDVEHLLNTERFLLVDGWAVLPGIPAHETATTISLVASDRSEQLCCEKRVRTDVGDHLRRQGKRTDYDHSGFLCLIDKTTLTPGDYRIKVIVQGSDLFADRPFRNSLEVAGGHKTSEKTGGPGSHPLRARFPLT